MKIKGVGLDTIEFSICSSDLRLPLIKVRLSARLAIQLLDFVASYIEEVAVICLLIRGREAPED